VQETVLREAKGCSAGLLAVEGCLWNGALLMCKTVAGSVNADDRGAERIVEVVQLEVGDRVGEGMRMVIAEEKARQDGVGIAGKVIGKLVVGIVMAPQGSAVAMGN
jgi:hypothetical protein